MGSHIGCTENCWADSKPDSAEKCSSRLGPRAYQSSGMEEGRDTSRAGWRKEMGECDRVCVSVRICGVDQEWVIETRAEPAAGSQASTLKFTKYNFSLQKSFPVRVGTTLCYSSLKVTKLDGFMRHLLQQCSISASERGNHCLFL